MFNTPIKALIASDDGTIKPEFAALTSDKWAELQMLARYGQLYTELDSTLSFPAECHAKLKEERKALESWFDDSGRISPTLQSIFMMNRLAGPIEDGLGWDFRPDGMPEYRMLVFKGTLLAVWRSAHLIPPSDRHCGNLQFGGLAALVKSAYIERARLHTWRGYQPSNDPRRFSGAEMSQRWVAHRTFLFLLRLEAETGWSWEVSGCHKIFGPVDERKAFL